MSKTTEIKLSKGTFEVIRSACAAICESIRDSGPCTHSIETELIGISANLENLATHFQDQNELLERLVNHLAPKEEENETKERI